MGRIARKRATRMARGTSRSGRQLCLTRGVSRGIESPCWPQPRPRRHFDTRRGPRGRQRALPMMFNHRRPIETSRYSAARKGLGAKPHSFPQAYAVGLQDLSPQGAVRRRRMFGEGALRKGAGRDACATRKAKDGSRASTVPYPWHRGSAHAEGVLGRDAVRTSQRGLSHLVCQG